MTQQRKGSLALVGQLQAPGEPPKNVRFYGEPQKNEFETVTVDTTAYTVEGKRFVLVDDDTAAGVVTVTLPPAMESSDREITIKKLGTTANVLIDGNAAETIDGAAIYTMTAQYEAATIVCDGAAWHQV